MAAPFLVPAVAPLTPRTALEALAGPPQRFLASAWPWRSLAYLLTGIVPGSAFAAVLTPVRAMDGPAAVPVSLVVAAVLLTPVARFERWRLRYVDRQPVRGLPGGWWPGWREAGHTLVGLFALWWVDLLVAAAAIGGPAVLILSPVVQPIAPEGEATLAETFAGSAVGLLLVPVAAYTVSAWAGARAAMARAMLVPQEAEVREIARSRARLVDAFDAERRRIERDLHDGAQQRLVALSMKLGLAGLDLPPGSPAALRLDEARELAGQALEELRELIRGVHPQVLADRGLPAAVRDVAGRSPVPARADIALDRRLPERVEAAAYYVACEALANVAKHSGAGSCTVRGRLRGARLVLEVADDGRGGADPAGGTGLTGLADRVAAVGGTLTVDSPCGGPTTVRAEIPCER
ncbi:sensor histidine kinase [Microbispora triticiradicis]|uniref:histidine kinase n=3 Tax=Microbispora TaxID=2005 RepID=A0ABY3LXS1_9ACTN|nr:MULTISPECIES: sensor histidine kinase [Microbispora]RGA00429.1 sensor histidine kinase [Microbispora triticiradicis]TLP56339.1 sensor histidine kinase [Microbispora fusca]TYB59009.1 sensor histidine kinase [Microbispora tritici]